MTGSNSGRKTAPAHLRLLDGAGRGPGRDSGGRKVPDPIDFKREAPKKPTDLSPNASRMWDAIVAVLPDANLLKPIDGFALEVGCETWARWYDAKSARLSQATAGGGPSAGLLAKNSQGVVISPFVRIESEASRDFRSWCAEFGLTPAAEARLASSADPAPDGDLF